MKTATMRLMEPTGGRMYARSSNSRTAAGGGEGFDADSNLWVSESEPDDEDDLDQSTAFDITGGEWEPASVKVRRKLSALCKRLF